MISRALVFILSMMALPALGRASADDYQETAFIAAQRLINSATSEILSGQNLISADDGPAADLIRERRSLQSRLDAIRSTLAGTIGNTPDINARRTRLLESEIEITGDLRALNDRIEAPDL